MSKVFRRYKFPPDLQLQGIFKEIYEEISDESIRRKNLGNAKNSEKLDPITAGCSIFKMNKAEGKHIRNLLLSNFYLTRILGRMDPLIQRASIFIVNLKKYARIGEIFLSDEVAMNHMMDISEILTL
ncbi:hypothetical protein CC78DRAFT_579716 [Lojkania enalia]|uniref:Uncharacterized protein n=1 Tax=Lojkania enalia TaxID=147567 RepID=A0A9P4N0L1_9PLEO|nr:hypothetical protein CC78DRAFT_579716 [Didymosphaeria enalia]